MKTRNNNLMKQSLFFWFQLASGPLAFVFLFFYLPQSEIFTTQIRQTLGLGTWMFFWWILEPAPLAITALLPLVLLPVLGIEKFSGVAHFYSSEIIFLFLGGFFLSRAIEKWEIHGWIAHRLLSRHQSNPRFLIFSIMALTAFISMWISNTAAALIMLPLGLKVGQNFGEKNATHKKHILLAIAYCASIGGLGTPIGSPPNALLFGYLRESHPELGVNFLNWILTAGPLVVVGIGVVWLVLISKMKFSGHSPKSENTISDSKPLTKDQLKVVVLFFLMVLGWTLGPFINKNLFSDSWIAILGGMGFFFFPAGSRKENKKILGPEDIDTQPWNILLLFGGGLALANAFEKSGLLNLVSNALPSLGIPPGLGTLFVLVSLLILLTEISSNTALAALFVPLSGVLAKGLGLSPIVVSFAVVASASLSFMLPMASPPNAIAFSMGKLKISEMIRVGWLLNLIFAVIISVFCWTYIPLLW